MRLTTIILSAFTALSLAEIKTPSFISDGMVLQQGAGAPVWGWAAPNESVTVSFNEQSLTEKADADGLWKVTFQGLEASKEGRELTITAGADKRVIKDVLVGEVWIASGQSNMEWSMSRSDSKEYAKTVNNPLIRQYKAINVAIGTPQDDLKGEWQSSTPETTPTFTAVGYHFAEKLHTTLDVPVGILELAWGGKPVEAFTSEEALDELPEAQVLLEARQKALDNYNPEKVKEIHTKKMAAYEKKVKEGKEAGTPKSKLPKRPMAPLSPEMNASLATNIYNGMVHPFIGYGVKGAIWYQGESNANSITAAHYGELLGCMVKDWRTRWGSDFSFYYVQIANFIRKPKGNSGPDGWVLVQDEKRRALKEIAKSGMVVTNDIGDPNDIHPGDKKSVGERLAHWALAKDYGKDDVMYSGPLYKAAEFKDAKVMVSFDYAKGLKARDGKDLATFELAGEDGAWVAASAVIKGDQVIVTAESLKDPVMVRYAWKDNPEGANLVNEAGLPTSCFSSNIVK